MDAIRALKPVIRWKLKVVMADKRMSATRLAELLGHNRVTVTNWANSGVIPPFKDPNTTLNQMCNELKCTPSDLIEYTPDLEGEKE